MEQVQMEQVQMEQVQIEMKILNYLESMIKSGFKILDIHRTRILMKADMVMSSILLLTDLSDLSNYETITFEVFKRNNYCVKVSSSSGSINRTICNEIINRYYMKKMSRVKTVYDFEKFAREFATS